MRQTGLYENMRLLVFGLVSLCVLVSGQTARAQEEEVKVSRGIIYYDYIDQDGVLRGGVIKVDPTNPHHTVIEGPKIRQEWNVATIINNGDTTNRVDLVFVGDGYQELELGVYATDVSNMIDDFFDESPLDEYESFFNVHRVDVISVDSGVDHDPVFPIWRNTALDMGFWTMSGGQRIERLLSIDVWKASEAANEAPDSDQILALANSSKYGGGGYIDWDIATASGHDEFGETNELALHEFGHSFGNLGDEYWLRD